MAILLPSTNSRKLIGVITRLARAVALAGNVDRVKAFELAVNIEPAFVGKPEGECVIALCLLLLRALGVSDTSDHLRIS